MNVLSLFDGLSCGQIAFERAGIEVKNYFASEIKPHAIKVTQENYPNTIQLGDITNWKNWNIDFSKIDIVIGGSPCQDLSGANKERNGLEGVKSNLFYTYMDILFRVLKENPKALFLLENVRMTKGNKDIINMLTGVKPLEFCSSNLTAQLRKRLYWTNIQNIEILPVLDVKLNDILTSGYSDREKARCLLESDSRPLSTPIKMCHRYFNNGFTTLIFKSKDHFEEIKSHFNCHFKGKSAKEIDLLIKTIDTSIYNGLRYMNKTERERLQSVKEGYTRQSTENDAACLLGDGWTVDVIAHIFKPLKQIQ